ncbi:MAG: 4Fe-4S dicluster domain-containing protein [candidate division KSB1 bacterium]|nr:4Fe-4S dicluster domain-containing protein [candidate division KSB1 bacterium]
MSKKKDASPQTVTLPSNDLSRLFQVLQSRGYTILGPTVRDGAIVYDELDSPDDLPRGWTDEQEKGRYRLKKSGYGTYFSFAVGPHSWKQYLYPPRVRLWQMHKNGTGFELNAQNGPLKKYAFLGVRSCELHAIEILDRVLLQNGFEDPTYKARRKEALIIVVQCTAPASTCFCASMQTGPKAERGFDLAMTEVADGERHYFVLQSGSDAGREIVQELACAAATAEEIAAAEQAVKAAAERMGRTLDTHGLQAALYANREHPHWREVGERCLNCTNCTQVCPTCFCTTVEDITDLTGATAERWRRWDSCFTMEFSYLHGGSVRSSAGARYRQWLTHKLASWVDQFGAFGCVGCGRCIAWCPVGIDITEEARIMCAETVNQ